MEKYCPRCKQTLSVALFPKNKARKSGYGDACKKCKLEYQKRPEQKAVAKKYIESNKEKIKEIWAKSHQQPYQKQAQKKRIKDFMAQQVNELGDLYIKSKLVRGTGLKFSEIPEEMVAVKRLHLQIHRELQKGKNEKHD